MRRYILLMGVLAVLGAALGCQHVAGKCDCGFNANDYPILPATSPYPTAQPTVGVAPPPLVKPIPIPPKGGNE